MSSFRSSQSQLPPARSSVAPVPAAIASPPWILLAPYGGGDGEACNITGDSKTIAAAATSNGHRISVSLRREPFSALSRICLRYVPGIAKRPWPSASSTVIAAHNGSVLVRIVSREDNFSAPYADDYFVYSNVGAAAADPARPPSLYLLRLGARWRLDLSATGFLCRGEADFVVAELTTVGSKDDAAKAATARPITFELRLFRHGEWSVKRPWIIHGHGTRMYRKQLRARWETIAVLPLGNGMLCWVDRHSGVIFSDVLDEGPIKLRYVPYPAEYSSVFTDVRGAVKLVDIEPHRCTHCGCSEHATAIDIWTLNTDDMAWVLETKTNMVDSTAELWELPYATGYARGHLVYPVASMNGSGHVVAGMNGGGDVVSDESAAPMEEEDEHMSLRVSTPSATASLRDGLQGGNGATSASNPDQQQGDNGPATVGRWPKRRRRANSMVTGPEWTA